MRGEAKVARNPVKIHPTRTAPRKPPWIRVKAHTAGEVGRLKAALRVRKLHTVCEEAACPNLSECFGHGTATFMILGDLCTRRCPFCDVAHGRPNPPDSDEPRNLAAAVREMGLRYVVVTSVDRDDLRDGGAAHFADCIRAMREANPDLRIEVLVPDFRGRTDTALKIFDTQLPDVFNHNLETVPRLYRAVRPGADYQGSLRLLQRFKQRHPNIPSKSGLMLGLGESTEEVEAVMADLRGHDCDMLTLGQYLQPSLHHLPVERFVHPDEFHQLGEMGRAMGFSHVASGPLVRSSYHADVQAAALSPRD